MPASPSSAGPPPRAARPPAARLLLAAAALGGLAACARGALPPREFYRLRPLAPNAPAAAPRAAPAGGAPAFPPLTVEAYATPGVYAGPHIVYRVGDTRYGTYPTREWAVPLGTMLAALTAEALRGVDGAAPEQVRDGAGAGAARGLVWRGTVREFEEVDRDGGAPGPRVAAAVRLDAQLVRAADDSVVWQGSAQVEQPVTPPDQMTAVVDGLTDAARRAVARLVRQAEPAMRAAAAAQAAEPRVAARR